MSEAQRVNILMVDDQPAKLLTYEAILADLDANLIKARSGREGLELLLKHDVAVVLLDVSMPEINGFDVLRALPWGGPDICQLVPDPSCPKTVAREDTHQAL